MAEALSQVARFRHRLNLHTLTHDTLLQLERRGGEGAAALIKQHVPTYEAEHVARPATSFFSPRAPEEQILHRGFR